MRGEQQKFVKKTLHYDREIESCNTNFMQLYRSNSKNFNIFQLLNVKLLFLLIVTILRQYFNFLFTEVFLLIVLLTKVKCFFLYLACQFTLHNVNKQLLLSDNHNIFYLLYFKNNAE